MQARVHSTRAWSFIWLGSNATAVASFGRMWTFSIPAFEPMMDSKRKQIRIRSITTKLYYILYNIWYRLVYATRCLFFHTPKVTRHTWQLLTTGSFLGRSGGCPLGVELHPHIESFEVSISFSIGNAIRWHAATSKNIHSSSDYYRRKSVSLSRFYTVHDGLTSYASSAHI